MTDGPHASGTVDFVTDLGANESVKGQITSKPQAKCAEECTRDKIDEPALVVWHSCLGSDHSRVGRLCLCIGDDRVCLVVWAFVGSLASRSLCFCLGRQKGSEPCLRYLLAQSARCELLAMSSQQQEHPFTNNWSARPDVHNFCSMLELRQLAESRLRAA